jgi:hypothetical protein
MTREQLILRNTMAIEFIKASLASNYVQKEVHGGTLVDAMFDLADMTVDRVSPLIDDKVGCTGHPNMKEVTPDELQKIIYDFINGSR